MAAIVYVAAFLPQHGQSLLDLTRLPEGKDDQVQANMVVEGDPAVATMPAEAARQAVYGCCSDELAAWAIARRRPQAVAPFTTPVDLAGGGFDGDPAQLRAVPARPRDPAAAAAPDGGRRAAASRWSSSTPTTLAQLSATTELAHIQPRRGEAS